MYSVNCSNEISQSISEVECTPEKIFDHNIREISKIWSKREALETERLFRRNYVYGSEAILYNVFQRKIKIDPYSNFYTMFEILKQMRELFSMSETEFSKYYRCKVINEEIKKSDFKQLHYMINIHLKVLRPIVNVIEKFPYVNGLEIATLDLFNALFENILDTSDILILREAICPNKWYGEGKAIKTLLVEYNDIRKRVILRKAHFLKEISDAAKQNRLNFKQSCSIIYKLSITFNIFTNYYWMCFEQNTDKVSNTDTFNSIVSDHLCNRFVICANTEMPIFINSESSIYILDNQIPLPFIVLKQPNYVNFSYGFSALSAQLKQSLDYVNNRSLTSFLSQYLYIMDCINDSYQLLKSLSFNETKY